MPNLTGIQFLSPAIASSQPLVLTPVADRNIGGIIPDVVIEERHRDEVAITEHPVEQSAPINDHAYLLPNEVIIRAGSSLSGPNAAGDPFFLQDLYQQLRDLKDSFAPFQVVTGKRTYENMMIRILEVRTDPHTENVLSFTCWLRQVIVVTSQVSSTASIQNSVMNNPQKTGVAQNFGSKSLLPTDL